ncbi:hypothetical protein [Paenibacillus flagellatus]|uniref:Uncharacterized protein n=1 Tax=Paenibacillus flagellatus TaxID=2211139 RepID=A0A2V5KDM6_9BACL|nr:hypothetical protein [Paenibacillus flagellatus]PYI57052.1 hypothetical protein DLM86_00975 [Paenibacillus flagellatus]
MPNLDRFATGLPDPQDQPQQPIDECMLDSCQRPIYPGQIVWKHGCDTYCSLQHLAEDLGASQISAGE